MSVELIELRLKQIDDAIQSRLAAVNKQLEDRSGTDELLRGEIRNLVSKYNELNERAAKAQQAQQAQLDELQKTAGRIAGNQKSEKTPYELLFKALGESDKFKAFKDGNSGRASIEKTVMTTGNSYTGEVIAPTRVEGIIYDADRMVHVRQFMSVGSTDSELVRYIRETSVSDAIADVDMIAEGALKTKQQFTLEALDAPVRKVAMSLDISDEMLNDTRGLTSYITARFGRMLPVKEDDQILYGAGGSVELTGITLEAAPFFNTTGEPLGADVQRMDILSIAVLQAMTQTNNGRSGYTPNAIMINPADFNIISRLKDADGRYLLPNAMERGLASVNGVPVVSTTAMKKGQFLVGDFRMGAQIFDRIGQRIEFSRENKDNFEKNLVTVVIESRLAMPIYRPTAFVFGDFASAIANYSA